MKSPIALAIRFLQDMGERCRISIDRDVKTLTERVEAEGDSFLTITLPTFGKDFLEALDQGRIAPHHFVGFRRRCGLPAFLQGFLGLVFDSDTGVLAATPSVEAIRSIHRLTAMFAKIERPCVDHRIRSAMEEYVSTDEQVARASRTIQADAWVEFRDASRVLFGRLFTPIDLAVFRGELIPKHGPGATAEKLSANAKYSQLQWSERLEQYFPAGEYLFPNWGWYHQLQDVTMLAPRDEMPVRVISVPKTQKTPRIIAIEPTWQQYCQQALKEALYEGVERIDTLRTLIGFQDQVPNQVLAKRGSLDGSLATLDLSEASDRVSVRHVEVLLGDYPHLLGAVFACRSSKADVPGHGTIDLAKFASMGSALCFPVEAMVFLTIVFIGIARAEHTSVTRSLVREFVSQVRVFGDDIIVPSHTMQSVTQTLEAYGLKVNRRKSFGTGRFRESCGGDFYAGEWVTPIRLRQDLPQSRRDAEAIAATVAMRNQLFVAGYEKSVEYLDEILKRVLPVYPELPVGHSAMGRWTYQPVMAGKTCERLHKPLIKACVLEARIPRDPLEDHGALMKFFLRRGAMPSSDRKHLEHAGRPVSVDIKTRWVDLTVR